MTKETPTPETDAFILANAGLGPTDYQWREHARRQERERDEARDQLNAMREAIKEGHDALTECVDDSGELLAERGWWQDEPRCDYQIRYDEHKQRIEAAKAALAKLQPFLP